MTSVLIQLINEWTRPIVVVQETEVQGRGYLYNACNDVPVV